MNQIISILLLLGAVFPAWGQGNGDELSFKNSFEPISEDNIVREQGYHNWGSSIIKAEDGKYHLFYSRWAGDFEGWLTFSEIAHAISDHPHGPWKYRETVLRGRGKGHWDAITAHNPKIKYFDGKYYLYYISTHLGGGIL